MSCSQGAPSHLLNFSGPLSPSVKRSENIFPAVKILSKADARQACRSCSLGCLGLRLRGAIGSAGEVAHLCSLSPESWTQAALAPTSLMPGKDLWLFPATRRSNASPGPTCSDPSPPGCWAIPPNDQVRMTRKREPASSWPHLGVGPRALLMADLKVSLSAYRLWVQRPREKGQSGPQAPRLWEGLGSSPIAWVCAQSQHCWVERSLGARPSSPPW